MTNVSHGADAVERVVELHLPSRLGYEKVAMDAAASIARRMGFSAERIDALRTALAEAVTNAIEHGNAHDDGMRVLVILTVRPSELVVSVADQGSNPIDESQLTPAPRIEDSFARADRGGWGIWLIRELMDEVEFTTAPTGGNQVRMVIYLEKQS